jgi:hypothetical protein
LGAKLFAVLMFKILFWWQDINKSLKTSENITVQLRLKTEDKKIPPVNSQKSYAVRNC